MRRSKKYPLPKPRPLVAREAQLVEQTVGVRELRQNLSIYLDRVKAGETLTVTEHGQAVAMLRPLPMGALSPLDRLIAEGVATAPTRSLRDLSPPRPPTPGGRPMMEILDELREDRF